MATNTDVTRTRAFRPEDAAVLGTGTSTPGWDLGTERRSDDGQTMATGVGWFSLALGLAEVVAPEKIAGELGLEDKKNLVRLYGFREIAKGAGILSNRKPAGWVWGRVAGDVLDLATLASGLRKGNPKRDNVLKAISAVVGVTVLDVVVARQLSESKNERVRHD
ncbi:MAG: hypothetical protein JO040_05620 [Gemmatimonadetes bacterium]|nr:hypothetical protein [Gemmatimonadota bacterium]